MQLHLGTRIYGDVAVVDCNGRLVFGEEAQALCDRVTELLRNHRSVVINLSAVKVIDGAGLGVLAKCAEEARDSGHMLCLFGLQRSVRRLIDLTKLSRVIEVFDNESEAVEASRVAA